MSSVALSEIPWVQAACLGADREKWFVVGNNSDANKDRQEAKQTCLRCPIRVGCLDSAMAEEDGKGEAARFGIRGGLSPKQRYDRATRPPGAQPKQGRVA